MILEKAGELPAFFYCVVFRILRLRVFRRTGEARAMRSRDAGSGVGVGSSIWTLPGNAPETIPSPSCGAKSLVKSKTAE